MISLFCLLIMSKTEIGKRIRNIRILNGLSQSELGEKLGLTADRIQKYENGARNPKVSMIFRIANALDVNAAALYDPTPCDDLSTMFFFFEMEEKYGETIMEERKILTPQSVQQDLDALGQYKTADVDRLIRRYVKEQADAAPLREHILTEQQFHRIYYYVNLQQIKDVAARMAFIHNNLLLSLIHI